MKKVVEEIEVIDEVERKRASLVFQAYMDSEDKSQYNLKIKELSTKLNLTATYLRSLREIYVNCCASDEEKMLYGRKKTEMNSMSNDCVVFCDKLFSLREDERCAYLLSKNMRFSALRDYLKNYKKKMENILI